MKIYTRKGDKGETSLWGKERVSKDDPRVVAYGEIDELNSWIGFFISLDQKGILKEKIPFLENIQRNLFAISSEIAFLKKENLPFFLSSEEISLLEKEIDALEKDLPPLKNFILPGGSPLSSSCHILRCICRRVERSLVSLNKKYPLREEILAYINRLSDFLFVFARFLLYQEGKEEKKLFLS